ncbi:MAG: alpha/beta fold hydrolase [Candidatus Acidiferrales bacterium]
MSEIQLFPVTGAHIPESLTHQKYALSSPMRPFEPHPLLRNPHMATVAAAFWPRKVARLPAATDRLFEVEPGTRLLAKCQWQRHPQRHPTLVLIHGLEGSSESHYMLGIAEKGFASGFNILRMNQRNCGGTEHLTPTLYNAGLSGDYRAVLQELIERDALSEIFFAGYSLGGNLVLKMVGELGPYAPQELRGICAVCPGLDPAASSDAIAQPLNFLYERHFLFSYRRRLRRKAKLFPERYSADDVARYKSLREWDEAITAPKSGYHDAADYYYRTSALRVVARIRVPTLIITAQNDPIVPFASFCDPGILNNPFIKLIATQYGGHCGFISRYSGNDRFWVEPRVVEFCKQHLSTTEDSEVQKQDFVHTAFGRPVEALLARRAVTQVNADFAGFRC